MNDAFENLTADLSESERAVALASWQACQARYVPVVAELQVSLQDALPCAPGSERERQTGRTC